MIKKTIAIAILVLGLCFFFNRQEQQMLTRLPHLKTHLPAAAQKAMLGYLKQVSAEFQFILIEVFLGKATTQLDYAPIEYASDLSYNFKTITDIYPNFIDSYYLCQSSLSYISPEYAIETSEILMRGALKNPDNVMLPFFAAFNYFYHAKNNQKASEIYFDLSQRKDAPKWLGHLAAVLSAKDGDLQGGLLALQLMLKSSTDEEEKKRYQQDILIFKKALKVAEATKTFQTKYQTLPEQLHDMVPEFLDRLPDTGKLFKLNWDGDTVRLIRPEVRKKEKNQKKDIPLIFL